VIGSILPGKYSLLSSIGIGVFCVSSAGIFYNTGGRGGLKMETDLFIALGIAAIAGIAFLIFFKVQDREKRIC